MTQPLVISCEASRQRAVAHIGGLSLDGKQWEVKVARKRKRRTLNQNALYWAWITKVQEAVSDYTGYEKDEIANHCKQEFLPSKVVAIDGARSEYRTTTNLSTKEMADYMDRIHRWASMELGLVLPLPPVATEERR